MWSFVFLAIARNALAGDFSFGPMVAFPVPGNDVGDSQLGIDAGATVNMMKNQYVGLGLEVVYHYWPTSPEYKTDFDRYLSSNWYQVIDGSTWAFSALQMTGHLKLMAPVLERPRPWVQIGGGLYRIDRNLGEPDWSDSPVIAIGSGLRYAVVPGWYGSVGFDYPAGSNIAIGLDATYHQIESENKTIPTFSAFTLGTHILFGR